MKIKWTKPIKEIFSLKMEEEFARKTFFWDKTYSGGRAATDSTFFAIGCFTRMKNDENEIKRLKSIFKNFYFKENYLKLLGGVAQCRNGVSTIYSNFCTLSAIADFKGICDNKYQAKRGIYPLKKDDVEDLGLSEEWENITDGMFNFVKGSFNKEDGGFRENPWAEDESTSVINSTALRTLTIIKKLEKAEDEITRALKFIKRCILKTDYKKVPLFGFSSRPESKGKIDKLLICSTFYVYKTLFSPNYEDLHKKFPNEIKDLKDIIKENEENVINLVKLSWKENGKSGGFCIGRFEKEPPTVVHTQQSLTLLMLIKKDLSSTLDDIVGKQKVIPKIYKFLEECKNKDNKKLGCGYGFTRDFTPSILATRHAIDILDSTSHPNRQQFFEDIKNYIKNYFYDEISGGYFGFPKKQAKGSEKVY